jgi:hypothetical protein
MVDYESQTYSKKNGEICNIFINEISSAKKMIVPNDASTIKLSDLLPSDPPQVPPVTKEAYAGTH